MGCGAAAFGQWPCLGCAGTPLLTARAFSPNSWRLLLGQLHSLAGGQRRWEWRHPVASCPALLPEFVTGIVYVTCGFCLVIVVLETSSTLSIGHALLPSILHSFSDAKFWISEWALESHTLCREPGSLLASCNLYGPDYQDSHP